MQTEFTKEALAAQILSGQLASLQQVATGAEADPQAPVGRSYGYILARARQLEGAKRKRRSAEKIARRSRATNRRRAG